MITHLTPKQVADAYAELGSIERVGQHFGIGARAVRRFLNRAGVVRKRGNQGRCKGQKYAKR